jgi:hypothetical protein
MPDFDGNGRQCFSDVADPVVSGQDGGGLGDGVIENRCHRAASARRLGLWTATVQALSITQAIYHIRYLFAHEGLRASTRIAFVWLRTGSWHLFRQVNAQFQFGTFFGIFQEPLELLTERGCVGAGLGQCPSGRSTRSGSPRNGEQVGRSAYRVDILRSVIGAPNASNSFQASVVSLRQPLKSEPVVLGWFWMTRPTALACSAESQSRPDK